MARPLVENHCSNTLSFFVVVSYIDTLYTVWVFARWILTSHFFLSGAGGPECPIISAAVTHAQLSGARETTRAARHALVWASEPANCTGAHFIYLFIYFVCESEICAPEYSFLKWAFCLHALMMVSTASAMHFLHMNTPHYVVHISLNMLEPAVGCHGSSTLRSA